MTKLVSNIQIPTVEYRGGIYYLILNGRTPFERGYQHGSALTFPIKKALRQFKQWLRATVGLGEPEAMISDFAKSTPYLESAKSDVPDLFEEMRGIAEGAGVSLHQLFVYQSFDEFFLFLLQSGSLDVENTGHCTTAGVYGRVDRPNYVGHNNDIPPYHEEVTTVLHILYPDSDLAILQSTFAGQIGQNGVNNRGVSVGINTVANLPGSDGVPVSFHVRKILTCAKSDEAVAYLKQTRFAQAMNYMIGDRDRIVNVETWEKNSAVLDFSDHKYVVHTNHALHPEAPKTFEMSAEVGGGSYGFTVERLSVAKEILSAQAAGMTLDSFKQLFKTRPVLVYPGKPTGRTLMNMIAEIPQQGSPVLYLTPDSPNIFDHVRFVF